MQTTILPIIVITRPESDAKALAERVSALGYEVVISPVSEIVIHEDALAKREMIKQADVMVVSSQHALGFLHRYIDPAHWHDTPLYVPSEVTASLASEYGAKDVRAGEGDAATMLARVTREVKPNDGQILYVRGDEVRVDAQTNLSSLGYKIDGLVVYHAPTLAPTHALVERLRANNKLLILLYSVRAGAVVESWLRGVAGSVACDALCLSQSIANSLDAKVWGEIHHVTQPHSDAMVDALKTLYGGA
jgi:uroporphyrinogen-III synthase